MADEMIGKDTDKFAPGAEQSRQDIAVGVSIAMTLVGMTCVALRVFTRAHIVRNMGPEDWTMIVAAVLTFVLTLEFIVGAKKYLMGFSGMSLSTELMEKNIQMTLAIIVTYKTVVTLIKISILMIYLRLAVVKIFERLCKATIGLLIVWNFLVIIIVPAQCRPLEKLWDFAGVVEGTCIDANAFYHGTSAFHIIVDIWILILPIKYFLAIPRPPREKMALYFVFGLGVFSTIASIVRFHYLRQFTLSDDPFYESTAINMWSMIEVNVGILCASLPTLKPLFSKTQRNRTREILNKNASMTTTQNTQSTKKGPRVVHAKEISVSSPMSSRSGLSWPSSKASTFASSLKSSKASTFASSSLKSAKSSIVSGSASLKSAKSSFFAGSIRSGRTTPIDEEVELIGRDLPPPVPPKDEIYLRDPKKVSSSNASSPTMSIPPMPTAVKPSTPNSTSPKPRSNSTSPKPTSYSIMPKPRSNTISQTPVANSTSPKPASNSTSLRPAPNSTSPKPASKPAPQIDSSTQDATHQGTPDTLKDAYLKLEETLQLPATVYTPPR